MYIIVLVVIAVALSFVRDTFAWRGGFNKLGYPWYLVKKHRVTTSYTSGTGWNSIRVVWPVSLLNKAWAVVEKIKEF